MSGCPDVTCAACSSQEKGAGRGWGRLCVARRTWRSHWNVRVLWRWRRDVAGTRRRGRPRYGGEANGARPQHAASGSGVVRNSSTKKSFDPLRPRRAALRCEMNGRNGRIEMGRQGTADLPFYGPCGWRLFNFALEREGADGSLSSSCKLAVLRSS